MAPRLPGTNPPFRPFRINAMNGHEARRRLRCAPSPFIRTSNRDWVAMASSRMLARNATAGALEETCWFDTALSAIVGISGEPNALMTGQRPKRAGSGNPIAALTSTMPHATAN
jgi:hypothetical protein